MFVLFVFLSVLFPLSLATNWQHHINVSSSDGVNDSSCWTGHVPCATLNLALEGLHDSTVIYLYPGIYTLENEMVKKNYTIGIIGIGGNPGEQVILLHYHTLDQVTRVFNWIENVVLIPSNRLSNSIPSNTIGDTGTSNDKCTAVLYIELVEVSVVDGGNVSFTSYFNISTNSDDANLLYVNELQLDIVNVSDISGKILNSILNNDLCYINEKSSLVQLNGVHKARIYCNDVPAEKYPLSATIAFSTTLLKNVKKVVIINLCEWPFEKTMITTQNESSCIFMYSNWVQCLESLFTVTSVYSDCPDSYYLCNRTDDVFGGCMKWSVYHRVECSHSNEFISMKQPNYCISDSESGYCPITYSFGTTPNKVNMSDLVDFSFCSSNRNGRLCGSCVDNYSVPINFLNKCVNCNQYPLGWLIFIVIQILPMTLIVLLIIIFNIQLTNGTINGLIFFYQILSITYPGLTRNVVFNPFVVLSNGLGYMYVDVIKRYVPFAHFFNFDFTSILLDSYSLCITSTLSPLGAISFWYVIGLYPLVLPVLLYGWVVLYDKGYKHVVLISRPIHRCLARFWHMTKIEPSLLHSLASIYLLCFTQLLSTSLLLLHFTPIYDVYTSNITGLAFFYDGSLNYFGWPHSLSGTFAIVILVFLVFIPMLFIQLYPLKLFHKLLDVLHVRKQVLVSLGDVFTGSYKNTYDGMFDYRYFAGFYFFLRIIIIALPLIEYITPLIEHILSSIFPQFDFEDIHLYKPNSISFLQCLIFLLFGGMIMIFRPHIRNVHNFSEFILSLVPFSVSYVAAYNYTDHFSFFTNMLVIIGASYLFFLILLGYCVYHIVKMMRNCCLYCKSNRQPTPPVNDDDNNDELDEVDNDEFADRIENPDEYDEQHNQDVPILPPDDDEMPSAAVNYGTC